MTTVDNVFLTPNCDLRTGKDAATAQADVAAAFSRRAVKVAEVFRSVRLRRRR